MDFTFTEEQETIAKVARQLFEHRVTPERLTELEAGGVRCDPALWNEVAMADLLGIALPEAVGGSGHGFLELALLLTEVGWSVAPVPVYATLILGADPIARHGSASQRQRHLPDVVNGNRLLTAALAEPGRSDPTAPATTAHRDRDGWRIDGSKELVPAAQVAHTILIPATVDDDDVGLFILDLTAPGVEIRPARTDFPATAPRWSVRSTPARSSGCARPNSVSPSARCESLPPTQPNASSSVGPSAASRRCSNAWPTRSSTSRQSGGQCGRPRGCSPRTGRPLGRPASRNSGRPTPAHESPRPPSRCTAE